MIHHGTEGFCVPSKRVVNLFNEVKIPYSVTAQSWGKIGGKRLEISKIFPQLNVWNIVDDVEQRNTCARIVDGLYPINLLTRDEPKDLT